MKSESGQGVMEFVAIGVLLIIVCLIALWFIPPDVAQSIEDVLWAIKTGEFGLLEQTDHATKSHAAQQWNATTITEYFDTGNCSPNSCIPTDYEDRELYWCDNPNREDEILALFVSLTTGKVITGYNTESNRLPRMCGLTP